MMNFKRNIGIVITRIGSVDGVALETEKWIAVLEKMGHRVFILTGHLERKLPRVDIIPELYLYHPSNIREQDQAFLRQTVKEETLLKSIEKNTDLLEKELLRWIVTHKIDLIISQNASALPCHLSMGLALKRVIETTKIEAILHHHDFAWERRERYATLSTSVKKIIREAFPPKNRRVKHVVINDFNKKILKEKFDISATYVPNVMDFKEPFGKVESYNKRFLKDIGLSEDSIVLSQVTRLVQRKGVETALELVAMLDDPKFKLLITGNALDESTPKYYQSLVKKVKEMRLEKQVLFIHDRVDHFRGKKSRKKIYSLSDVYAHSNACTYFSTYEGFGNAFVEAVIAKKPIFVNNYKPVYWPNIGSLGFKTVMLEKNKLTRSKVEEVREILANPRLANTIARFNYHLAKQHFSFEVLEKKLKKLVS